MNNNGDKSLRRRAIVKTLLFIEGGIVLALAGWLAVFGVTHEQTEKSVLFPVIIFALLGGLGLIASGDAFGKGRMYGRAPAVLANLIALGVVYYQVDGGFWIGAIPLALIAVPTLYLALRIFPDSH